jgi:hypothetical protein
VGIAVRIALMSITWHGDLLFIQYYPHFLSMHQIWDGYGHWGPALLEQTGASYYPPLTYYLIGATQFVAALFNDQLAIFFNLAHQAHSGIGQLNLTHYMQPFSKFEFLRILFMMKLPYLIVEIIALCILRSLNIKDRAYAIRLWILSPIIIYSTYVFGQYRIVSATLILLSLLFAGKNLRFGASFVFGLICLMESAAVFLLPVFVMVIGDNWMDRLKYGAVAALTVLLLFGPLYLHSKGMVVYAYMSPLYVKAAMSGITRHFQIASALLGKGILLSGYTYLCWNLLRSNIHMRDALQRFRLLNMSLLVVLLLLFATTQTSIHYFMWAIPFWVILHAEQAPWHRSLSFIAVFLLFVFNLDTRSTNLGLFAPLNPEYFLNLSSLHEVMDHWLPWGKVIAFSRLTFSGFCLYFSFRIYQKKIKPLI